MQPTVRKGLFRLGFCTSLVCLLPPCRVRQASACVPRAGWARAAASAARPATSARAAPAPATARAAPWAATTRRGSASASPAGEVRPSFRHPSPKQCHTLYQLIFTSAFSVQVCPGTVCIFKVLSMFVY